MTISPEMLAQDAAEASTPSDDGLAQVSELAQRQVELEDLIAQHNAALESLKRDYEKVRTELLPEALREHGLTEIRMVDGSKVEVQKIVRASIPERFKGRAFAWLDEQGHADLIKHVVSASFGKGEDDRAKAALETLSELGVAANDKRSVHPGTLSAFVREQTAQGVALPDEILGVFRGEVTKIRRTK